MVLDGTNYTADEAGTNVATLTVTDSDLNVLTDLTNTCTSGQLVFKCTLVGTAGAAAYTMNHTNMEDTDQDDIPNPFIIRALQAEVSGFISTGTSAATGAVVLANTLGTATVGNLLTTATSVTADILAGSLDTAVSNFAQVAVVITSNSSGVLDTNGIQIKGTSVNKTTLVETASDSEIVVTGTVANGTTNSVKFWKAGTVSFAVDWVSGSFSLQLQELGTIAAKYRHHTLNDTDDGTTKTVTVTSTVDQTGKSLTLGETLASSGVFDIEVALINIDKLASINALPLADTVLIGPVTLAGSLLFELDALSTTAGDAARDWVSTTVGKLADVADGSSKADLLAVTLKVGHGGTLTATYNDKASVPAVDTAALDLNAPATSAISPADGSATSDTTPTFTITLVDADSGIDSTTLVVRIGGGNVATPASFLDPISDGFTWTATAPTGALTEGATEWEVEVKDKVGNATLLTIANATKDIDFTIDVTKPSLSSALTGTGIKLDTADADGDLKTDDYVEYASNEWIKLTFSEDLSQSTLSTSDIDVAGSNPLEVMTGTGIWNLAGTANLANPKSVAYIKVDALATDAKPKVKLVDAVTDKAGNASNFDTATTTTTQKTAEDKLAPIFTVTSVPSASTTLSKEKVTITMTSSETLAGAPTITVATNDAFTEQATTPAVSVTGTMSWQATFTAPATKAAKRWVKVVGTDANGNVQTTGDGTPTADRHFFQTDTVAPLVTVTPATVEEGDIFIRLVFDENEGAADINGKARGDVLASSYTDEFKKVTLTAATLTNKTSLVVEDVLADFFTKDSIDYVLVKTLSKAKYDVKITFVDEAGNTGTKTQEVNVTALLQTTISLVPGFNFFSLPGDALSAGLNDIIGADDRIDLVVGYDPTLTNPWVTSSRDLETGLFVGDLTTLVAGQGYIAKATAFVDLKVDIPTAAYNQLPGLTSVKGNSWNLIGPATRGGEASIDADAYLTGSKWTVCVTFNPDPGAADAGWTNVRPDSDALNTTNVLLVERSYLCWFTQYGTLAHQ